MIENAIVIESAAETTGTRIVDMMTLTTGSHPTEIRATEISGTHEIHGNRTIATERGTIEALGNEMYAICETFEIPVMPEIETYETCDIHVNLVMLVLTVMGIAENLILPVDWIRVLISARGLIMNENHRLGKYQRQRS